MFKIGKDYIYRGFVIHYTRSNQYICHIKAVDDDGKVYEKDLHAHTVPEMIKEIDAAS